MPDYPTLEYERIEKQWCPNCSRDTMHLVSKELFEGIDGYVCKTCGGVWHYNDMGGQCVHAELPMTIVMMAKEKINPRKVAEMNRKLQMVLDCLPSDALSEMSDQTRNYDMYGRLER